jgi:hypothetical protein
MIFPYFIESNALLGGIGLLLSIVLYFTFLMQLSRFKRFKLNVDHIPVVHHLT